MRKIFANLKSVVALAVVAAMTLSVSCMYDDTALTKRVDKVEKDLAALTEKVNGLNGQEVTLDSLLAGKLVITGVTTDEATGNKVITLSDGSTITVLAECEGLQYRTENGVLEISADGETWVAVTANASCLVKEVVTNADGTVTIVFADGTEFTSAVAELIECAATRSQVYVLPEVTKAVRFTINDAVEDINVMNQPLGWSATVEEYVEVEEPDYGGGVMPLAVGGKEYVLNITGPAKDFAQAAKEGVVSVHFNTAAGACKVMNVAVNLAELTLKVDAAGNVTITNTVALEQADYWGNKYTDFVDFFIGVMPKSLYEQYGNDALVNDYDDWMYDYTSAAVTQRTSGLNSVTEILPYEEGVYEKETLTFTVDELANAFYPNYNFEIGSEYIIFVATDYEMVNNNVFPVLDTAVMADYKCAAVSVRVVEGTEAWNNATVCFSLAGYDCYCIGWMSESDFQYYNQFIGAASFEEFLPTWLSGDRNYMYGTAFLFGMEPMLDVYAELTDFVDASMGGKPSLSAGTEYRLFVYPFNAASEMDLYMHTIVPENIIYCGTFTTAELVAGEFEAGANFELVQHDEEQIVVNATFSEEVVTVAYCWFEASYLDAAEAVATIMSPDNYETEVVTFDEYTTSVEANKSDSNGLPNPIYLGVVAINANGEYVYCEKEFKYVAPEPEYIYNFNVATNIQDNTWKFSNDAGEYIQIPFYTELTVADYEPAYWAAQEEYGYDVNNIKIAYNGTETYLSKGKTISVSAEGDIYTITGDLYVVDQATGNAGVFVRFTFVGSLAQPELDLTNAIAINEFKYLGRQYDIDDNPETSGGDYVYELTCADDKTFKLGLYWEYANNDGTIKNGTINYCSNILDVMYSSWNGFVIVSDQYYYGSTLTVEEGKIVLNLVNYEDTFGTYVYNGAITM